MKTAMQTMLDNLLNDARTQAKGHTPTKSEGTNEKPGDVVDPEEVPEVEDVSFLLEESKGTVEEASQDLFRTRVVIAGYTADGTQVRRDFAAPETSIRPEGVKGQRIAIKKPIEILVA